MLQRRLRPYNPELNLPVHEISVSENALGNVDPNSEYQFQKGSMQYNFSLVHLIPLGNLFVFTRSAKKS